MQTGNTQTKEKGFTLIELLVVIAIIGLLSTIGLGLLRGGLLGKGRDAQRMSHIREIALAMETGYNSATNEYPSLTFGTTTGRMTTATIAGVTPPKDPGGGAVANCSATTSASGEEMTKSTTEGYCGYANSTARSSYCVYAKLSAGGWFIANEKGIGRHDTTRPTGVTTCNYQ